MIMTYRKTHDPGHSWLRVPIVELHRLEIADQISSYSYMKNSWAYLEEDRDMAIFLEAKEQRGEEVKIRDAVVEHTRIRSYEPYENLRQS